MRRALRGLGLGLLALVGLAVLGATYFFLAFPAQIEAASGSIDATAEQRARGVYLAEHVAVCVDCHSERDFSRFSGPVVPGTLGQGGQRFGHDLGVPGEVYARNITPHAALDLE